MATVLAADATYREKMRKTRLGVLAILGFSLLVFIAIAVLAILNEGVGKFVATLESINLLFYAAALVCVFLSTLICYPKWAMFVKKLGIEIPWRKNLAIYMSMFSMDITPGRWGRAAAAFTLNRVTRLSFGRTFPAVVADILTDFLGFIAVALVSAFLVRSFTLVSVVISILLLIPFFFIYVKAPFDWVRKKLKRVKFLKVVFATAQLYFKNSRSIDLGAYAYAMLFTIPSVILASLALYFVILSFGISIGPALLPTVAFIYTSSLLIGMVTGIPGTIGVTDAALIGYLVAFFSTDGVTFGVASAIVIFFRIASLWFSEGVGTLFLVYTFRYWKFKKPHA